MHCLFANAYTFGSCSDWVLCVPLVLLLVHPTDVDDGFLGTLFAELVGAVVLVDQINWSSHRRWHEIKGNSTSNRIQMEAKQSKAKQSKGQHWSGIRGAKENQMARIATKKTRENCPRIYWNDNMLPFCTKSVTVLVYQKGLPECTSTVTVLVWPLKLRFFVIINVGFIAASAFFHII